MKFLELVDEEGDFFFLENVYRKYLQLKNGVKKIINNKKALREWTQKHYLNLKTLNQSQELIEEISNILGSFPISLDQYQGEIKLAAEKIKKCKNYREIVLSCLISSFSPNLCKYSGNPELGFTLVNQRRPVQVFRTSNLSLLGIEADWIICYDLYTNSAGRLNCRVAHKVSFDFIKNHCNSFIQERFQIQKIQDKNPFYQKIYYSLPTSIIKHIKGAYCKGQRNENIKFLQETYPIFREEHNEVTFFILDDETN